MPFPFTAEFIAVEAYVVLTAIVVWTLARGPRSPARAGLTVFIGLVGVNRLVYLASLVTPSAARWAFLADGLFPVAAVALLAFAYSYGGWAYHRERRVVLGLASVAALAFLIERVVGLPLGAPRYEFEYLLYTFEVPTSASTGYWPLRIVLLTEFVWAAVVLARKGLRPPADWQGGGERRFVIGARALGAAVFAGALMPVVEALEYASVVPVGTFSAAVLLQQVALVVVYAEHAPEPTSLRFRLSAISLSVILAVISVASVPAFQAASRASYESRMVSAERVRALIEAGQLTSSRAPADVAYVLERRSGASRLVVARRDLSLSDLEGDLVPPSGSVWSEGALETGPDWDAVGPERVTEWSRGARAPQERQFDAVVFEADGAMYEAGIPHALHRARLGRAGNVLAALVLIAGVVVMLVVPVVFRGSVLRPIERLREGLARVEGGDLEARVSVAVEDEVGTLSRSFNRMAEALGDAHGRAFEAAIDRAHAEAEHRAEQTALRHRVEMASVGAERLRELDRLKTEFFTNVSHEFRTPLTLTIGPLQDLQGALDLEALPESARLSLELALRNSDRLLRLTNQLLDAARLEAGEMQLHAQPLEVGSFVQSVAFSFEPLAERRGLRLHVEAERDLEVWVDVEKLETAVSNVVSNALKFTPAGGDVWIEAEALPTGVAIRVRDTGPGIEAADLERVFDRFYRVDESHELGTGIGLALARDLVKLHGGTLEAESQPGHGSTFTIRLPAGRAHLDENKIARGTGALEVRGDGAFGLEAALQTPDTDGRAPILVVDDNPDLRAYIRSHLSGRYHLLEAEDGARALEVMRDESPDLVLSDVMMPNLDGIGLVQAMRASPETDAIPVILISARAEDADVRRGLEAGADAYIVKPFNARTLRSQVESRLSVGRPFGTGTNRQS